MAARPVRFFATCLIDQFDVEAGLAAVEVLEAAGCDVSFDADQTCCGQPAFNLGHVDEAREVARRAIRRYQDGDAPIVVPSGSCATMMHEHWPRLFPVGSAERAEAERVAAHVVEWSRFLVRDLAWRPPRPEAPHPAITYHPSCHGLRGLRLAGEAEALLEDAGHRLVPLPAADECCGFGGGFSVEMPEMSGRILQDKLDNIETSVARGAGQVACLDTGCLMHMRGGHERRSGAPEGHAGCPRYVHVAVLLRDALRARGEAPASGATDRAAEVPDAAQTPVPHDLQERS